MVIVNLTRIGFLAFTHANEVKRVFLPVIPNMFFVAIKFFTGKDFVRFSCLCGFIICNILA